MTVQADIKIARKENVPSIPVEAFHINQAKLCRYAADHNIACKPSCEQCHTAGQDHPAPIWIYQNNEFIEKEVRVGLWDDKYYELLDDLHEDHIIVGF